MESKELEIVSGFFGRKRRLILTEDFIELKINDGKSQKFERSEIIDFKHGAGLVVWYHFPVGKEYSITLKSKENKEMQITFQNYFGLRPELSYMYQQIVNDVWELYHADIVDQHLERYFNNQKLEFQGVVVDRSGVKLKAHNEPIRWEEIGIQDYNKYFAIFKKPTPTIHSRISFNEYGSETLWSLLQSILKERGIVTPQNQGYEQPTES